jgi:hypothetical protein
MLNRTLRLFVKEVVESLEAFVVWLLNPREKDQRRRFDN